MVGPRSTQQRGEENVNKQSGLDREVLSESILMVPRKLMYPEIAGLVRIRQP